MPPFQRLSRAAVAAACSLTLALPATARAQDPVTDELHPQAETHVSKALQAFKNGAYVHAEEDLRRAAFFTPNWRPLHFNLAVVAEAQGKLGTAISEYKTFKPYATADEAPLVDQRLFELADRRNRIATAYKRQIAVGAVAMSLGVGALGGAVGLFVVANGYKQDIARLKDQNDLLMNMGAQYDVNITKIDSLEAKHKPAFSGAVLLVLVGVLIVGYSALPLSRSIKSKRQLDGIAIGPTRLRWAGGASMVLRF